MHGGVRALPAAERGQAATLAAARPARHGALPPPAERAEQTAPAAAGPRQTRPASRPPCPALRAQPALRALPAHAAHARRGPDGGHADARRVAVARAHRCARGARRGPPQAVQAGPAGPTGPTATRAAARHATTVLVQVQSWCAMLGLKSRACGPPVIDCRYLKCTAQSV